MYVILNSNPSSTVTIDRYWLGGKLNPYFKVFFFLCLIQIGEGSSRGVVSL